MAFETPILFLVFNRPDTTAEVFGKIRQIQPSKLFIAADGPREFKDGEKEKCEAVRQLILKGIDWHCEVKTLFREQNLGCGKAVSSAINWFFQNVEEGIILEDDTLPDLSFFYYCQELLMKYRNVKEVKIIGATNFQNGKQRGDGSYYFSSYSHIWGWATWQRTWKEYDFTLKELNENAASKLLDKHFSDNKIKDYWLKIFNQLKAGKFDTWDLQLLFSIMRADGKAIIPNVNLVTNIGFGMGATHTTNENDVLSNIPSASLNLIKHPTNQNINHKADAYTFYNFFQPRKNRIRELFSKLKKKLTAQTKFK